MIKGGYKIIDLKNESLSTTKVVIDGIYEGIEASYKKPILLSNINIGGTEKNDLFVEVNVSSGNYVFACYGGTITITDDDEVTYTANV